MRVRLELYFLIVLTSLAFPSGAFNPYGVVTDGSRSEYDMHDGLADLIKVGGMGYERVDWDWRACQKEKGGAFDFSRYDKIVEADVARGVTVLPIVYGPPSWAYPAWQHLDGYAAFVRETVRRYGKRMPVIEIWNEQNIAGFWKNPNPTNYLALLKVAYKAAKEVDPSVRVALGGTAGWAHGFIRSLYAIGAKDYFDIVNVHPYCYPYPPEEPLRKGFEELRKIMAEYGDAEKPIWFTEIGWPTHEVDLTGPGNVLLAGLKTARPEKTSWNVIYAVCKPDGEKPDQSLAKGLLARLPPGSTGERTPRPSAARIDGTRVRPEGNVRTAGRWRLGRRRVPARRIVSGRHARRGGRVRAEGRYAHRSWRDADVESLPQPAGRQRAEIPARWRTRALQAAQDRS